MGYQYQTSNNPNLTCIVADDPTWANSTWTVASQIIDQGMFFSNNCPSPCAVSLTELNNTPKQLLKIVDLMGRETPYKANTVLIYMYSDGTTERVFKLED